MKFALEIRTREIKGNKTSAWYCQMFENENDLEHAVNIMWELKDDFKKTHVVEIEYVTHLDRVHGRV